MWDKARRTSYSYLDICRYGQKLNRLLITTYLTKLVRALSKENCQNMIFHKSYKLSIYMLSYFDSFMHLISQLHILIIVILNELLEWFLSPTVDIFTFIINLGATYFSRRSDWRVIW